MPGGAVKLRVPTDILRPLGSRPAPNFKAQWPSYWARNSKLVFAPLSDGTGAQEVKNQGGKSGWAWGGRRASINIYVYIFIVT